MIHCYDSKDEEYDYGVKSIEEIMRIIRDPMEEEDQVMAANLSRSFGRGELIMEVVNAYQKWIDPKENMPEPWESIIIQYRVDGLEEILVGEGQLRENLNRDHEKGMPEQYFMNEQGNSDIKVELWQYMPKARGEQRRTRGEHEEIKEKMYPAAFVEWVGDNYVKAHGLYIPRFNSQSDRSNWRKIEVAAY